MENVQDRDFLGAEKRSLVNLTPIDELKGKKALSLLFVLHQVRKSEPFVELKEAIFNLHSKKLVRK